MRRTVLLLASLAGAMVLAVGVVVVAPLEPAQAAFPGENGRIMFVEKSSDGGFRIRLIRPDGSGLTTLVPASSVGNVGSEAKPAMSPGGTRVAYAAGSERKPEIHTINIRTRTIRQITDNEVFDGNPAWSPDGTHVAFERKRTIDGVTDTDIYVRRIDGTGRALNLTDTLNEDEFAPAWSPNGKRIAFHTAVTRSRDYDECSDVFVMNLATGQRRNLTNDGTASRDCEPNWSPDGARIVFQSESSSRLDDDESIYTMNASDGSDKQLLAEGHRDPDFGEEGTFFFGATYSPNGKKIAYVRVSWLFPRANLTLFKMNASDGSNKRRILDAGGGPAMSEDEGLFYPDWGRKPLR